MPRIGPAIREPIARTAKCAPARLAPGAVCVTGLTRRIAAAAPATPNGVVQTRAQAPRTLLARGRELADRTAPRHEW
jgi:hypothetical protein